MYDNSNSLATKSLKREKYLSQHFVNCLLPILHSASPLVFTPPGAANTASYASYKSKCKRCLQQLFFNRCKTSFCGYSSVPKQTDKRNRQTNNKRLKLFIFNIKSLVWVLSHYNFLKLVQLYMWLEIYM